MKTIAEKIISLRNGKFKFDDATTPKLLVLLAKNKMAALLRGLKAFGFNNSPKKLMLGKNVRFFNKSNIRLGNWVRIEDYTYVSALGKGKISIGNGSGIGAFSRIVISTSFDNIGSHITIGNNVGIGEYAYLGGAGGLDIGDECIVGQYFSCHPENHVYDKLSESIRYQGTTRQGIKIGRNCWIGSKVTILDGVEIGDNSVIAAGAVVTKSMPPYSVIGGVPARVLKDRRSSQDHLNISYKPENIISYA